MTPPEHLEKIVAYGEDFLRGYTKHVDLYSSDVLARASERAMTRILLPFHGREVGVDLALAALYTDFDFYLYFLEEAGVGLVTAVDASHDHIFDRDWTVNAPAALRSNAVVERLAINPQKIIPVSPNLDVVNIPGTDFLASSVEVIRRDAHIHGNSFAGQAIANAKKTLQTLPEVTLNERGAAHRSPVAYHREAVTKQVIDNGLLPLIAAYRDLRDEAASLERTRHLAGLAADLLRALGTEAAGRGDQLPIVMFRHGGQPFLMGLSWTEAPLGVAFAAELLQTLRGNAGDATVILLSMAGYESGASGQTVGGTPARTLLWDRAHFEAILAGLVSMSDLLAAAARIALFEAETYAPLTHLLTGKNGAACPRMFTPDLLAPPWPVLQDPHVGVPAQVALVGEDGWAPPSGMAALDTDRLAVVTSDGLVELDPRSGATEWMMPLPGCVNEPLVQPDGSVLVVCNSAILRVSAGKVEAVAGGLSANVRLLVGPGGEPWALSGIGPSFGSGQGTLALTRLGDRLGDQHRYDIQFEADVHTAAWLEQRRFFMAATGHSAVVDLDRSSCVGADDWIVSPHGYRAYMLGLDRRRVVIAAGNTTGLGITLWRTDIATRESEEIGRLVVNAVRGLCAAPDGVGYLLGDVYGARRDSHDPWPVLIRFPGLRSLNSSPEAHPGVLVQMSAQAAPQIATHTTVPSRLDKTARAYDAVQAAARGHRKDYALDPRPIDGGGQAEVFRARHKPSGLFVAYKKLRSHNPEAVARMQREIEVARALGDNAHIMPVLDHSDQYEWFVMPLAQNTAATDRLALSQHDALKSLVTAICEALRRAHALGWIHRDLKPANLLSLDGVWVVGDWGYTRRPRGQTTNPARTRIGALLGTEGFAAPELSIDAHQAGPQADVYSIGQIIGWILRGEWPRANTPLLPTGGPWRHVVRKATQFDPANRPATVDDLLEVVGYELDFDQPDGQDRAVQLLVTANDGDAGAAAELFGLAMRRPNDLDLYTEVLARLHRDAVHAAVAADRLQAVEVVRAMSGRLRDANRLAFGDADRVITCLHWVEVWAAEAPELELLHVAVDAVLAWDAYWDQGQPRKLIKEWMARLNGDAAAVVAGALRDHRSAARHFEELAEDHRVDERIRRAVRSPQVPLPDVISRSPMA